MPFSANGLERSLPATSLVGGVAGTGLGQIYLRTALAPPVENVAVPGSSEPVIPSIFRESPRDRRRGLADEPDGSALRRRPGVSVVPSYHTELSGEPRCPSANFLSPSSRRGFRRSSSLGGARDPGSWRRRSISLSRDGSSRSFEDVPSEVIAQVGDSGDRMLDGTVGNVTADNLDELESWRKGSIRLSHDLEDGILEDEENLGEKLFDEEGGLMIEQDAFTISETDVVPIPDGRSPLELEKISLPTDSILYSKEEKISTLIVQPVQRYKLSRPLDYMAYMLPMAVFGILGLFGPGCLALTRDGTPLYLDLPANMVSFSLSLSSLSKRNNTHIHSTFRKMCSSSSGWFILHGWFGLVFKGDVRHVSDHLAVALTTGFMGSLTTFSGWNQKMLDLSSEDHWVFAAAGIILGFFIVNESFRYGVASADFLREHLLNLFDETPDRPTFVPDRWAVRRPGQHAAAMTAALLLLCSLWGVSGAMTGTSLDGLRDGSVLFNGRGLGKKAVLKWLPIGTMAANILAALAMGALSTADKEVDSRRAGLIIRGLQFGFLGCLSTVSTFAAEVYAMRQSGHEGRALAYAAATFVPSFAMGTLIYSVPVWIRHYH
ncbi:unnamed protein product [Spirodela intermedia]|uniref:Uncharacterized protein n=1 Tax=Spirodela intermedia TaxID=51605 RepID=A0A7I8IRG8_SPIIN|nr:unnamed protein product [Spirodela intermedia]CAA6660581.1 unnamed protein product [Spirodela intermedia]